MKTNRHALRSLREARGLTILAASAAADVPQPNWSRLEQGEEQPGWERLVRIADALGVPVEALVAPDGPVTQSSWPFRRGRRRIAS